MSPRQPAWIKLSLAAAVCVGLLLSWAPLSGVLALDFQTLLRNLEGGEYVSVAMPQALFTWGEAALRLGALPWALLVMVGLLLRLRSRWGLGSWTLHRISLRLRLGLAALVLVPLGAFCLPLGGAMATWLLVEAHWWIQWHGNREPVQWAILDTAPPLLAAATLVFGIWGTVRVLRRPRGPAVARRWYWRVARWAPWGVPVLLAAVVLVTSVATRGARVAGQLGSASVFVEACGGCHSVTRPLYLVKTPDEWRYLVRRIKRREALPLTTAQEDEVVSFLQAMRSFPDRWTFRSRCQRCHLTSYLSWEDRHPDDWRMIVDRVGRYSPHYFPPAVRRQVTRHLGRAHADRTRALGLDPGQYRQVRRLTKVCTGCHFLSRRADQQQKITQQGAEQLVRRMSRKMAQPVPAGSVQPLARAYRLLMEPGKLRRLVPHDRPQLAGDLPW